MSTPTEPGWYWARYPGLPWEPALVEPDAGYGSSVQVWGYEWAFSPGDDGLRGLVWGPRIEPPPDPPKES